MTENTNNTIEKDLAFAHAYFESKDPVKRYISEKLPAHLEAIQKESGMQNEKWYPVADTVGDVLVGVTPPEKLKEALIASGLDGAEVGSIASKIHSRILTEFDAFIKNPPENEDRAVLYEDLFEEGEKTPTQETRGQKTEVETENVVDTNKTVPEKIVPTSKKDGVVESFQQPAFNRRANQKETAPGVVNDIQKESVMPQKEATPTPQIAKTPPQEKPDPENTPSTPTPSQNNTPEQKKTIQEAIEAKLPTPDPYREAID